jgi:hypothetical protein
LPLPEVFESGRENIRRRIFSGFGASGVRVNARLIIRQVVKLLNDLRKTALIAGVAMAVAPLWGFGHFLTMAVVRGTISLPSIAAVVFSFLVLDAPLPVFLLMFYRSGITLLVSKPLRNRALVLALIRGLDLAFTGLREWRERGGSGHVALPSASRGAAFYESPTGSVVSDAITLFSMLAFLLFLIALSRQVRGGRDFEAGRTRLVKGAALIAAGSRVLYLVAEFMVGMWIYSMQRRGVVHDATSAQVILRTALFALPGLAAPLIIYASIGTPRDVVAGEDSGAQVSATA